MMFRVDHCVVAVCERSGGVATAVRRLAAAEAHAGCVTHMHALMPVENIPGVEVHGYVPSRCCAFSYGWSQSMRTGMSIAASTADVLHSHNLWTDPTIYAASAIRGTECRLVCSPHGGLHPRSMAVSAWRKKLVWSLGQRATLCKADLLHATSEAEVEHIRLAGLTNPVTVIPLGVDIPASQPHPTTTGPRRLAFLGRLHRIKALDRLLRAWASVAARHGDWELVIRGPDGGSETALRHLAARVPRVTIGPPVTPFERNAWYQSCDLLVLPSHAENFGLVVAEALASAVPVIASTGTPWSGLSAKGCGWWVNNDVDTLAAAFDSALSLSAVRLQAMGAIGRDWMATEFSWELVASRMIAAYQWLRGNGPRPAEVRS